MNKEILRLAIPNIISNISIPLLSAVDTALMGHLSPMYLGAIGIGSMIFNFIYWNFGFLRMGTTGMVSQAYGAKNTELVNNLLIVSLRLSLAIALIIMIVSPWLFELFSSILLIDNSNAEAIKSYSQIRILDAPATLMLYVMMGWFFGRQNAVVPLIVTVMINAVNIVVSYSLVTYYGMAIAGVAWGTVLSQYLGLVTLIGFYVYRYDSSAFRLFLSTTIPGVKTLSFLKVNSDLFIRTVCLSLSFLILYRYSNSAGPIVLAANVIILQLISWVSFGVDGFAFAAESIVGKYKGANQSKELLRAVNLCFYWGLVLSIGYSITYSLFLQDIISLYTIDESVINEVHLVSLYIVLIPLLSFLCYIYDGIYIGLLQTRIMRDTMIFSLVLFIIIMSLFHEQGNIYLWISFSVFLLVRGLSQSYLWHNSVKKSVKN